MGCIKWFKQWQRYRSETGHRCNTDASLHTWIYFYSRFYQKFMWSTIKIDEYNFASVKLKQTSYGYFHGMNFIRINGEKTCKKLASPPALKWIQHSHTINQAPTNLCPLDIALANGRKRLCILLCFKWHICVIHWTQRIIKQCSPNKKKCSVVLC